MTLHTLTGSYPHNLQAAPSPLGGTHVEISCGCGNWTGGTYPARPMGERAHQAHVEACKPVNRPMVPVRYIEPSEAPARWRVVAECRHCDWTKRGQMKAEIELYVSHHREMHRRGAIEVTR